MMTERQDNLSRLTPYLADGSRATLTPNGVVVVPVRKMTPAMKANAWFFSHPRWASTYFAYENFSDTFAARWRAALGSWEGRVVVDLGCGPGNLARAMGRPPGTLIGIDISSGALENAARLGYIPLRADVHETPLRSGIADIVTANATLHHCDDMACVLREAARLVRPGGLLVTDEDPLWHRERLQGLGLVLSHLRATVPLARVRGHPRVRWRYRSYAEQRHRRRTEVHNRLAGDGITRSLFRDTLEPLGFSVSLYPHNHAAGAEVLQGERGSASLRVRLDQRLSGIDPDDTDAGLSVMCIATKSH